MKTGGDFSGPQEVCFQELGECGHSFVPHGVLRFFLACSLAQVSLMYRQVQGLFLEVSSMLVVVLVR